MNMVLFCWCHIIFLKYLMQFKHPYTSGFFIDTGQSYDIIFPSGFCMISSSFLHTGTGASSCAKKVILQDMGKIYN